MHRLRSRRGLILLAIESLIVSQTDASASSQSPRDVRMVALTPPHGAAPPALVILSPGAGEEVEGEGDVPLTLALDVAVWCADRAPWPSGGGGSGGSGSGGGGGDGAKEEAGWGCAPLEELVVCLHATGRPADGSAEGAGKGTGEGVSARQWCRALPEAMVGGLSLHARHLPVGSSNLDAHLFRATLRATTTAAATASATATAATTTTMAATVSTTMALVSTSASVAVHRAALWDGGRAAALRGLLPLDKEGSATAGLRLGWLRHGPLL